jgi:tRNA splicing endonuclease
MNVFVNDLETATILRRNRLLTSSLRFEPTFKHESDDDPDEPDVTTKKGRKVAGFAFDKLLPLTLTREETTLATRIGLIALERVGSGDNSSTYEAKLCRKGGDAATTVAEVRQVELDSSLSDKDIVFHDLWNRKFCMVDGLKFGVDFLAYAKDPTRHHADFMILVCNLNDVGLHSNLEVTAMCTVAAKAKKIMLLASVDRENSIPTVLYARLKREPIAVQ